jgi:HJR/Mrr/RecB family endonuclease
VCLDGVSGKSVKHVPDYLDNDFTKSCSLIVPDFEKIDLELIEHFSKHPSDLESLGPRKFEELLEAVFRNHGYRTELTALSGDKGVDLRLWHKDAIGDIVTLVQAKRYSPLRPIGIEAVQALFGAVEYERANRGIFVTTSRYLPGAQEWGKAVGRRIVLATSKEVARWCKQVAERRSQD